MEKAGIFLNPNKKILPSYSLDRYIVPGILEFHRSLKSYSPTPLHKLDFQMEPSIELLLKDESKRLGTGAFKALGASWAIHDFLAGNRGSFVFCTATDGNHGRAVAWSARINRQSAVIFMPSYSVPARIDFIRAEGAEVILVDGDYDETVNRAVQYAAKNNCILIQDTSWEGYHEIPSAISAGYTTLLRELEDQVEERGESMPDVYIFQSGVGSWAASMMLWLRRRKFPDPPVLIVAEPSHSDCLMESARNGILSRTRKDQKTIMAGLNCGTPSLLAWEIIRDLADAFISIPDRYSLSAMKFLRENNPPVESCESGAAGLACLLAMSRENELKEYLNSLLKKNKTRFLIFNTEGNTDPNARYDLAE